MNTKDARETLEHLYESLVCGFPSYAIEALDISISALDEKIKREEKEPKVRGHEGTTYTDAVSE